MSVPTGTTRPLGADATVPEDLKNAPATWSARAIAVVSAPSSQMEAPLRRALDPLLLALLAACSAETAPEPAQPAQLSREIFAGLGQPVPYATPAQRADFERGRELAERLFTEADGLGPRFNTVSCAGCHQKPVTGGTSGRFRNFYLLGRTSPSGRFEPAPRGGISHAYGLGEEPVRPPIDAELDVSAQRKALSFFGAGLIAEIPADVLLAGEDPDDVDGNGISGRANRERGVVSRFGRKAQTADLVAFVRGPLNNHLGITTDPLTPEQRRHLPVAADVPSIGGLTAGLSSIEQGQIAPFDVPFTDDDAVPDPELSEDDLFALASFTLLLAPPPPDPPTPTTEHGRALFAQIGCADCHTPALEGPRGPIPLYADLLLHDMGTALADGLPEGDATGSEWRTAPLIGMRHMDSFLHDGRASSVEEAIELHEGPNSEANDAVARYRALTDDERAQLVRFVESL